MDNRRREDVWVTSQGVPIPVNQLSLEHLQNIVRLMCRARAMTHAFDVVAALEKVKDVDV